MAKSEGNTSAIPEPWASDVDFLLRSVANPCNPRGYKEEALRHIRRIERETGRSIYGEYNGASRNPSEMARVEEEGHE